MLRTISVNKDDKDNSSKSSSSSTKITITQKDTISGIFIGKDSKNEKEDKEDKEKLSKDISEMVDTYYKSKSKDTEVKKGDAKKIDIKKTEKIPFHKSYEIMVHYDTKRNKFIFHNKQRDEIGSFTVFHIIKFVAEQFEQKNKVMGHLEYDDYENGKGLIEKFVIKSINTTDLDVGLYDYKESPFMGDIELLIRLNNLLNEYESTLSEDLVTIEKTIRGKIMTSFKMIIYKLLTHTLRMISMASKNESKELNSSLKTKLLNYSIKPFPFYWNCL